MPPPNAPIRSPTGGLVDFASATALAAYRGLAFAVSPALPWLIARRAARGKADPERTQERFGRPSVQRPAGRVAWLHAASVGETLALVPLVSRIVAQGFAVVFTSGTLTSASLAARVLPAGAVHQYAPLDVTPYVNRFLDYWRPEIAIVAESELWPVTITILYRRGIPMVIVNGRLSDRSFPRWQRFRAAVSPLFARLALVLAQSPEDAARFSALGARHVVDTGNLKGDAPPLGADPVELTHLRAAIAGRPVWLAASTHAGEEEVVAAAHRSIAASTPGLLTLLVPRHPERGEAVQAVLAAAGLNSSRRSCGEPVTPATDIYVADTLGELGLFYRLAPVAFLGNSLTPPGGGHNPLEAIQLGAAVVTGPEVNNFTDVFARLAQATPGETVIDGGTLASLVATLLADPAATARRAAAQATVLAGLTGALDATLEALKPYLAAKTA
jgi:3-deoxy-D-manno-octulosonic-acid transferase